MITPLDIEKNQNNLEHHRLRHYTDLGHPFTAVYKTLNGSIRLLDLIRDTVGFRVTERISGGTRIIAVDPFANYFGGLRATMEASRPRYDGRESTTLRLLRGLVRLLTPIGALRDILGFPCMLAATLSRTPRRIEICFSFGPWAALSGLILKKLGRVRTVVYEDRDYEAGLYPDWLRRRYVGALERFGIRRADVVISISESLSELRRSQTGRETHVVPSGVDWSRFRNHGSPDRNVARLVFVGNLMAWSGVELAIRAMPRIRESVPGATLVLIGHGPARYEQHLRSLAGRYLPEDVVRFIGLRAPEDLPRLLAESSLGLACFEPVPFRRYCTPLKLIEYMAAGLPVVATEDTEAARLVSDYECGVTAPYDPERMAEAVIRVLSSPEIYARQSDNGVRHSVAYDWETVLERERNLIADAQRRSRSGEGAVAETALRENR